MNDTLARIAYEDWCRRNRKRKSDAGWEMWQAAFNAGLESNGIDSRLNHMPFKEREFILELVRSAIDTLKGGGSGPSP